MKVAKEEEDARIKAEKESKEKEEARLKVEKEKKEARLKAEKEKEEARLKQEKEDEEIKKALEGTSLKDKISGVADVVVTKSQSIIESAKSMTGTQRKQAVAFVAATGFGGAFLLGGKSGPAAAKKGRKH